MTKGKLIGVGLGAGDPDLITVKGLRALQQADIIFYPASNMEELHSSFSAKILQQLDIETPMQAFYIPMKSPRREDYYLQAYNSIKKEVLKGKNVTVVSEGDLLFYSTFGYLLKMATANNLPIELIPGIPAFIAGGAISQRPIIEGQNNIKIIALPKNFEAINQALEYNATVVIMKIKVLKGWYEYIKSNQHSFFYAENIGTTEQFSTTNIEDLKNRPIPYFALLIIYKKTD